MPASEQRRALSFLLHNPGASGTAYAKFANISQPAVHAALTRLEAAGLVERRRQGNTVHNLLTPAGYQALKTPDEVSTRDLVRAALNSRPTVSRRELAARLGVSPTTVQYHVRRLRDVRLAV